MPWFAPVINTVSAIASVEAQLTATAISAMQSLIPRMSVAPRLLL
jgi:hypothetical protein